MENTTKQYKKLGYKTLSLFILRRSLILFIIILLSLILFTFWSFIPYDYLLSAQLASVGLFVLFVILALIIVSLGLIEYQHYKIIIDDETIKIYRGLFSEEDIGLPFRHIKQANIERSLMDQFFGVSNINLTTLGEEGGNPLTHEDKLQIPALDKDMAQEIQDLILKRAEIEEINVDSNK